MKHLVIKGSKRFVAGVLMAGIFLLIPTVFNFIQESFKVTYYQNVPLSDLIDHRGITFEDMCYGDTDHLARSERYVRSNLGYKANISRELYKEVQMGTFAKIFEQDAVDVIIEQAENGVVYRQQAYDEPLEIGSYYWNIKINELEVGAGVIRRDSLPIKSNVFEVKECSGRLYDRINR